LLEEVHICTQHLKGFTHSDVMALPVYERRFHLSLLMKSRQQEQEHIEKQQEKTKSSNSKGNRQSKVSGSELKARLNSGNIPLK